MWKVEGKLFERWAQDVEESLIPTIGPPETRMERVPPRALRWKDSYWKLEVSTAGFCPLLCWRLCLRRINSSLLWASQAPLVLENAWDRNGKMPSGCVWDGTTLLAAGLSFLWVPTAAEADAGGDQSGPWGRSYRSPWGPPPPPYNGRGRLGPLHWSEAWSHLGTIDLDGHSGKRRELKDLFGPYLGYKWINLFVQGLLEDLCYFTLLFLLEQKDNWDVDLSFEELLIALTYASQCQCCPEEEIRSSCVLSLSGRHILLIVFLILNLIYFLSNFVSSTVCLHKRALLPILL